MRGLIKSKTFWLIFFVIFSATLVVTMGVFFHSQQRERQMNLNDAYRENREAAEAIVGYMDDILQEAIVVADQLRTTEWVQKLCADSEVFRDTLNFVRMRQVSCDYLFHSGSDDIVERRLLFFPYIDLCVGWKSWAESSIYLGLLGVPMDGREDLLRRIRQCDEPATLQADFNGGRLLVCVPVEPIRRPRAYLCDQIDLSALGKRVRQLMKPGVIGVRVSCGDAEAFALGRCDEAESTAVQRADARYIDWRYEVFLDDAIVSVEYDDDGLILRAFVIILVCALTSWALAVMLYRPVLQLTRRTGIRRGEASASDYQMIGEYIDRMTEQYRESRRQSCLHELIAGYFSEDEAMLREMGLPLRSDAFYRVIICVERASVRGDDRDHGAERMRLARFAKERGMVCETVDMINGEMLLIMMGDEEQVAGDGLTEALRQLLAPSHELFWGGAFEGLVGISLSSQAAREKQRRMAGVELSRFYLPLEWENQLMNALLSKNLSIAQRICSELRRENERRLNEMKISRLDYDRLLSTLISDLNRVVSKSDRSGEKMMNGLVEVYVQGDSPQIWECIDDICLALCEQEESASTDQSQRIVAYIDAHFCDSTLSLIELSNIFGLSSNTINKCIRQATGTTFHTYLTQCRIERAKTLLSEENCRIGDVAARVGYDTEYSFRRAFHRYTGIKAQTFGK